MTEAPNTHLRPGDPAPDFTVSAVENNRTISLTDYRGRTTLLLALFRGLYCPFCRRAIVQMAANAEKLKPLGIESLAVVATDLENARLYYRFRPTALPLAVDPNLTTHRSYGVPHLEPTPELMQTAESVRINPTGELPEPLPVVEASMALDRLHGFQPTASDRRDVERQMVQLKGQFLIGRDARIQWANVECAREGLAGIGKFPTLDELLAAVQVSAVR